MRMHTRNIIALAIGVLVAAGCVRLGIWQLDRLGQRRAINALAEARMQLPPIRGVDEIPADTGEARYRAVELTGTYDFENEVVIANRTSRGSPGVNIVTPLRIVGEERAVLVNRGWVYAPDGATVELERWREPGDVTVRGYLLPVASWGDTTAPRARTMRRLDLASLRRRSPYPLAPVVVVDTSAGEGEAASTPGRLGAIALDEGPHLGYALQWFSFAVIALVGVTALVWRDHQQGGKARDGAHGPPGSRKLN